MTATEIPAVGALRRRRLRRTLEGTVSRTFQVALTLLTAIGVVLFASGEASGIAIVVLGVGGWLLLLWWAWHVADSAAKAEWLQLWGASHELAPVERPGTGGELTALLRGGHRRKVLRAVEGRLDDHRPAAIWHYTYWVRANRQELPHPFTLCVVDLPDTRSALPVLHATPRGASGGLFDGVSSALTARRVVDLESVRLDDTFRLAVDDRQDDLVLRRVMTPAFMVWLEDLAGTDLRFELEHGSLVVALPDHSFDRERLDWLLGAGTEIARRIAAVPHESS